MYRETGGRISSGGLLFVMSAIWWGVFSVLLRQWQIRAHGMRWLGLLYGSAIVFVPIICFFLPKHLSEPEPMHLLAQVHIMAFLW